MIWSGGAILPDDGLVINAADRTFEHGLGLFETARTWGGRPTLLDRHRSRMLHSAGVLGLTIDPADFPDHFAVEGLLEAEEAKEDRLLRITATGGRTAEKSLVWMRSASLPTIDPGQRYEVLLGAWAAGSTDPMARHKALNYWTRRIDFEAARARGFHETLGQSEDGTLVEGSRSNLFIVRGGELTTPSLDRPIVPGVMRGLVMELATRIGLGVREAGGFSFEQLESADEVFLTNAVRGIMPVGLGQEAVSGRRVRLSRSGDWTRTLRSAVAEHLAPGGTVRHGDRR